MKIGACDKVVRKRESTILAVLTILIFLSSSINAKALNEEAITSETLTLTIYLDGYVRAVHELEIDQPYPTVNAKLLGQTYENLIVEDEQNLPLDFSTANGTATIYSLGANRIRISYMTQELISKTGKLWTLKTETSTNVTLILPEGSSIVSLSSVPEVIESLNSQVSLVMPAGNVEVTYIIQRGTTEQNVPNEIPWLYVAATALVSISLLVSVAWFLKRNKQPKQEEPKESKVDIDKLLEREKDLRPEEVQVINFLAEKNGKAFEAELYEKLNLPRTTTWRLLKRLEKMGILDIKKSRRQNMVMVRKKYIKN